MSTSNELASFFLDPPTSFTTGYESKNFISANVNGWRDLLTAAMRSGDDSTELCDNNNGCCQLQGQDGGSCGISGSNQLTLTSGEDCASGFSIQLLYIPNDISVTTCLNTPVTAIPNLWQEWVINGNWNDTISVSC